ncbi:MAG: hypothetical protein M3033_19615 [Acidobacteriota bacterium]|nr:hypothetical protein [Acidobacteriota bacterium]
MKKRLLFILCLFSLTTGAAVAQTKNVTNADLEKFRQKRLQSEKEYREKYSKLGFPSPEELEKQNVESRRSLSELSQKIEAENADNQESFQSRASFLRAQIASVEAQINYLRGELNRLPRQNLLLLSGYSPYAFGGGYYNAPNASFTTLNQTGVQINRTQTIIQTPSPRVNYNTGNNGNFRAGIRVGGNYDGYGRQHYYNRNYASPIYYGGYVAPYFNGDRSYEREEVNAQVRSLEQARAGLYAEWQVLEDEARRAGVKID